MNGYQLEHPAERPLAADGLSCSVLVLSGARITGHASASAVSLTGAQIGGSLDFDGAALRSDSGAALLAFGLEVGQDMVLERGFTATGAGEGGAVNLAGARIGGSLDFDGAELRNDSGPALNAYNVQVGQSVFLHRGFTATGAGKKGVVCLDGARIGGSLECDGAELHNDSGPALLADGLQVGQDMQCDRLTAEGGVVLGGHIGGLLSLEGAALSNRGGAALSSDGLRVDGAMFCRNGFTAHGEVRLPAAQIGGRLYFDGARLSNPGGRAFVASRLTVGQDMFCRNQRVPEDEQPFRVEGAVILAGAHIGGSLDCTGAQLRNDSGRALHADGLQIDQDMLLTGGFTAIGSGEGGAVSLTGAHISGNFNCTGASLRNDSGPALVAYGVQVGQDMYLSEGFTAAGSGTEGQRVAVNLRAARVGGAFYFQPTRLEHKADPRRRLAVGGLTYAGVPQNISAREWLDLLRVLAWVFAALFIAGFTSAVRKT